jgi:squalene-associated FAD-dependent desaturase
MTVHVIGAGLSGLAAAVALVQSGARVMLYEAAAQAGGRCRSYFDRGLDRVIDNGNHLLLSGNDNVQRYLSLLGAGDRLVAPVGDGAFRFVDLTRGRDFTLRPNAGAFPWWIADPARRAPDTRALRYFSAIGLMLASSQRTVAECVSHDELYRVLWEPLAVSALNTPADEASAHGFGRVLAKTLARGGAFSRPLIARDTLAETFVAPALAFLERRQASVRFGARVRRLSFGGDRVTGFSLDDGEVALTGDDQLILAVPPNAAERLVPSLEVPTVEEPIVNAHFVTADGPDTPLEVVAIVGGAAHWVFRRPGLSSITVSAARGMIDEPTEATARGLWADLGRAFPDLAAEALPAYRIVKEKRATIRQSPTDEAMRAPAATRFDNLWLAGDWTRTGLPATIEGAILSGFRAAYLADRNG